MANKEICLGDYLVTETSQPYLIAEIGINHNGDMQIAKKLLDATFACDWNCAKFQKRTPDLAVPEAQKQVVRDTPWGRMPYIEYKKRIEFEKPEYDCIDAYCKQKPLAWTASVWDIPSLEFLMQYDVPFIKIPSALNTNKKIIRACCGTGKPIIISTGMASLEEMDSMVEMMEKYSRGDYIICHTNSSYPSSAEQLNLKLIRTIAERYDCLAGYSGHEYEIVTTIEAALMGARVIERHVTLSHDMWGSDQKASVEVQGMASLQKRVIKTFQAMGSGEKVLLDDELKKRRELRGDI